MKLYSYWRSTTSYRVRAALNLKGLAYDIVCVDLAAADQRASDYREINPGKGVPTLVLDDGTVLTQSMAILEFLDAVHPVPRLIPKDPAESAKVMAVAHTVALDIHPVNNLRVTDQLKSRFGATPEQSTDWMCHWMQEGFAAVETLLPDSDAFAFGSTPNIADICITAQTYNARRWGLNLAAFPNITRIERLCRTIAAIADAHPDNQPDAKV
ncbi:MAG: maleylacetoacetate isomerase [Yoonia sp.]|jgi:maleylacetoacetate isomerase